MLITTRWLITTSNFALKNYIEGFSIMYAGTIFNGVASYLTGLTPISSNQSYKLITNLVKTNLRRPRLMSYFLGFLWYRFILFSGLGYKRRLYKKYKILFAYSGDRHWVLYFLQQKNGILPNRRRNFIFLSLEKGGFSKDYDFFCFIKKPQVYKMKGFMDTRVKARFLFVRRIKIRGVKTKLSKKQQFL